MATAVILTSLFTAAFTARIVEREEVKYASEFTPIVKPSTQQLTHGASQMMAMKNEGEDGPQGVKGEGRREALGKIAAAATGVALGPAAANAEYGQTPKFSVFGLIGDGKSFSEGAAYGSDQTKKTYSPYSYYSPKEDNELFDPKNKQYVGRKKAVLLETKTRLAKIPAYVEKKQWFNVNDELTRYMYETRGALNVFAKSKEQKAIAKSFFEAIEATSLASRQKKGDAALAGNTLALQKLDQFLASI